MSTPLTPGRSSDRMRSAMDTAAAAAVRERELSDTRHVTPQASGPMDPVQRNVMGAVLAAAEKLRQQEHLELMWEPLAASRAARATAQLAASGQEALLSSRDRMDITTVSSTSSSEGQSSAQTGGHGPPTTEGQSSAQTGGQAPPTTAGQSLAQAGGQAPAPPGLIDQEMVDMTGGQAPVSRVGNDHVAQGCSLKRHMMHR